MRRFAWPLASVLAGMATSWGLQATGVAPLQAKLAGLVVVGLIIAVWWRRKALP